MDLPGLRGVERNSEAGVHRPRLASPILGFDGGQCSCDETLRIRVSTIALAFFHRDAIPRAPRHCDLWAPTPEMAEPIH
jgi:hypothetical protein